MNKKPAWAEKYEFEFTEIDPEKAAALLMLNTKNRPVKQKVVDKYVRAMREGRWRLNGESIKIGNGRLYDGQHRLLAIVKAGVTVRVIIFWGFDPDAMGTVDENAARRPHDVLALVSEVEEKDPKGLLATVKLVECYYAKQTYGVRQWSSLEQIELLEKYPGVRDSVSNVGKHARSIAMPSVVAACHFVFSQIDAKQAEGFLEGAVRGIGLRQGDPWYLLRQRLESEGAKKGRISKRYQMALIIKAWNAVREGKVLKCLKWTEVGHGAEEFPVAI